MDWLSYLIICLQAVLAFPIIWFLAYVVGWGFAGGAAGAALSQIEKFMSRQAKEDEKDIL